MATRPREVAKREALRKLERAFRDWYWATGQDMPDVGIVTIGLSRDGCDLQYLGNEPNAVIDWPVLFAGILQQLQAGTYSVDSVAEVKFSGQP